MQQLSRERYLLAAFSIHQRKAMQYADYLTLERLAKGVVKEMKRGADFVLIRRMRPEAGNWRPLEKD